MRVPDRKSDIQRIVDILEGDHESPEALAGELFDQVAELLAERKTFGIKVLFDGSISAFGPWYHAQEAATEAAKLEKAGFTASAHPLYPARTAGAPEARMEGSTNEDKPG